MPICQNSIAVLALGGRCRGGWRLGPGWGFQVVFRQGVWQTRTPVFLHHFDRWKPQGNKRTAWSSCIVDQQKGLTHAWCKVMRRPSLCLVTFGGRKRVSKASHFHKPLNPHTALGIQLQPLCLLASPIAALPAWDLSSHYSTFYYTFDRLWIVMMRRQGQSSSAPSGAV